MAYTGYINPEVAKMYGIPYSQLTAEQRKILHADSVRRAKLIKERQEAVLRNNLKAFDDEAKMERVLASIYKDCQKQILADVTSTIAKVKKSGGDWSYANQSALTRSRGLFEQITAELTKLGQKEQILFMQGLSNIYTDQYLRQIYELGQSITVKANFNRLNPALVRKTLDYPWSGAMFSDRLWNDKETLGKNLRVGLTQSMILGEGIPEITDRINRNINTSRYNAERIARTETKRVTYCAHNDSYEDMGVEELEYHTAGERSSSVVCSTCHADRGKIYKRGTEPTLPRHPNCKCVYIPVVSDEFGDNELNELTGSVRGAENYEKWRKAEEEKLKKEANKEKTPEDLIRERIEQDKAQGKAYRDGINAQISTKTKEHDDLPATYNDQIAKIEAEKAKYKLEAEAKQAELDRLHADRDKLSQKRSELVDLLDAGKITEEECDERSSLLSEERKALRAKISGVEDEVYQITQSVTALEDKVRAINREIADKQRAIMQEIKDLNDKVRESLDLELDFDLDIAFVGSDSSSLMRYNHIEEFRSMRSALRANPTFDYDKYKAELVQVAQRMDEEALIIHSKLSAVVEKNWYDSLDGSSSAHYSPWKKRVNMRMSDNSKERSLGTGLQGSWHTKYHEEGHQIDNLLGAVSDFMEAGSKGYGGSVWKAFSSPHTAYGEQFKEAIEKDILDFLNTAIRYCNDEQGMSYKPLTSLSRITRDARLAFSRYGNYLTSNLSDTKVNTQLMILTDAIGCFTKGNLCPYDYGYWGHRKAYCKDQGIWGATSETWATFFYMRTCGSEEEVEMVKKLMPSTWSSMSKAFSDIAEYCKKSNLSY